MLLPRPLYEALPWLYGLGGVLGLLGSYHLADRLWSSVLAVFGVLAILAGLVIALRRRDFRLQKSDYGNPFDED
jgi:formate hydrogenlyase subunit 3/multisubunit Na+/H+ antiporter MnhD subunit